MPDSDDLPPVVLVSGYPPNSAFGGGLILRGLFATYPKDRLRVVCGAHVVEAISGTPDGGGLLLVRHDQVRPWRSSWPGLRRLLRSLNVVRVPYLLTRVRAAMEPRSVIVAVPWGGELGSELFCTAYLAHRVSGRPLVIYEMDEWRASLGAASGRVARLLERLFHGPMLRAGRTVWVMSRPMADLLRARFGVDSRVLPHSADLARFAAAGPEPRPPAPFRVTFGGAVYAAQADALARVAEAIRELSFQAELVIHTAQSPGDLESLGIAGQGVVIRPAVPVADFPAVLKGADVLVLPLSFAASQREVVRSSFPTKAVDYLAAEVPILVHAPADSALARRAREEGWALVVDHEDTASVVRALARLKEDDSLRGRLTEQARRTVRDHHDLSRVRQAFIESLRAATR